MSFKNKSAAFTNRVTQILKGKRSPDFFSSFFGAGFGSGIDGCSFARFFDRKPEILLQKEIRERTRQKCIEAEGPYVKPKKELYSKQIAYFAFHGRNSDPKKCSYFKEQVQD